MHYYLYEIKNTVNGKIYMGVHKTKSLDDGYMGSGKVVSNAMRKYGIEQFTKTILETFDNTADMFAREKEVVNDEFLARPDVYNLRRGGTGGFDYINRSGIAKFKGKKHTEEAKAKMGHIPSDLERLNASIRAIGNKHNPSFWLKGPKHPAAAAKTYEHKEKIRAAGLLIGNGKWNKGKVKPTVVCPHCGKVGSASIMGRWHFENCKILRA